jgi:myo-inositol-1(or 4)-monophosphatase
MNEIPATALVVEHIPTLRELLADTLRRSGMNSKDDYALHQIQTRKTISPDMPRKRYHTAIDVARRAGALLREGYGQTHRIHHKGEIDLRTEFDLRSEQLILDELKRAFPEDAVLAEESGSRGTGDFGWIIDPLDGTTNFAHGIPFFSVSIAGTYRGELRFGVVYDPMRDELFQAMAGEGAVLNRAPLHVSTTPTLNDSLLVTGYPYDIRTTPDNNLDHHARLALRSQGVRRLGAASLDLAYVAAGRFDGYWELLLPQWDIAAGALLVQEAGGIVTQRDGGEIGWVGPTSILATNGFIHQEMVQQLTQCKQARLGNGSTG